MILYFTGTGNSRYAAEVIARETGDTCVSMNDRIRRADVSALFSRTPFVVVCPVYAGRVPQAVEDYLTRTELTGSNWLYFVFTCAGSPARAYQYISESVRAAHPLLVLKGYRSVRMPNSWVLGPIRESAEEQEAILDRALPTLLSISATIAEQKPQPSRRQGSAFMSRVLNPIFCRYAVRDDKFRAGSACNSCGACEAACPVGNIRLEHGKPSWLGHCTQCCGCIAACPQQAIEFGKKLRGRTAYRCTRKASDVPVMPVADLRFEEDRIKEKEKAASDPYWKDA